MVEKSTYVWRKVSLYSVCTSYTYRHNTKQNKTKHMKGGKTYRNWKLIVRMTWSTEHVYGVYVLFCVNIQTCVCCSCFIAISTSRQNKIGNNFFFFTEFFFCSRETNWISPFGWIEIRFEYCQQIKVKLSSRIVNILMGKKNRPKGSFF